MKPTWLYLKVHMATGKFYLGKTVKDPETYLGSGLHWTRHIKKHGTEHVHNVWKHLFTDSNELQRVALAMSDEFGVTNSSLFLNMIPENGVGGWAAGTKRPQETRERMKDAWKNGRVITPEHREKMIAGMKGKKRSPESRARMSAAQRGRKQRGPLSEEARKAISEGKKGKKHPTEASANHSAGQAKRWANYRAQKETSMVQLKPWEEVYKLIVERK